MDISSIDEDPAAAIAAAEAVAAASAISVSDQIILSTPDRPKQPLNSSTAHTPATSYFAYNEFRGDYRPRYQDDHEPDVPGLRTPSLLSSPSVASSLGFSAGRVSPVKRELHRDSRVAFHRSQGSKDASPSTRGSHASPRANRDALAQRLSQLAHELTSGNDEQVDDSGVDLLTAQLDQLEGSMKMKKAISYSNPTTPARATPSCPLSLDMQSPGDSIFSTPSPGSTFFRTRFSDLSASIRREPALEWEPEPEPLPEVGMSVAEAKKIIKEATQLNEELSQLVTNLRARQEESEHIQVLLIERAERAAQRIMFLQNRISHLEQELRDNDEELQHLRICLKGLEIQMPPHPDKELQRCITAIKQDYQVLKRRRINRNSISNLSNLGSPYPGSPAQ